MSASTPKAFFSAAAEQAKADAKAGIAAGVLTRDVKITLEGEDHLVSVSPDKNHLRSWFGSWIGYALQLSKRALYGMSW